MVRHTKKEVNHGTYPLTTEEQAALKLQQQAASRKGRLLQVRQQEKVFAAQRARAYKERLHRCQKQIGQSLQDQWEEERQTALQQLEEQHARAMDMFGEGQRAALDAMQQHYAQKQLAAAKLAAAAHTAEQRFQEAHARLQADREAAMHDEVARLQRLRDTAQAEYARAAELVAAFRAKLDSEQVAKAAADQAEAARLQRGLYSGVDFRYTRLHEMGVPKLVEKHEGAGADGEGLDVQEAAQRATDGMWQHAERKVLATIENQETAEERGQAASLRLAMAASKQRMEAQLAALERAKREYKKHQAAAADPAKAASLLARRNNNDQKQKALERDFEAQFLGQARQPAHDAPTQAGDGSPEVPLHWTDYMPAGARQVPVPAMQPAPQEEPQPRSDAPRPTPLPTAPTGLQAGPHSTAEAHLAAAAGCQAQPQAQAEAVTNDAVSEADELLETEMDHELAELQRELGMPLSEAPGATSAAGAAPSGGLRPSALHAQRRTGAQPSQQAPQPALVLLPTGSSSAERNKKLPKGGATTAGLADSQGHRIVEIGTNDLPPGQGRQPSGPEQPAASAEGQPPQQPHAGAGAQPAAAADPSQQLEQHAGADSSMPRADAQQGSPKAPTRVRFEPPAPSVSSAGPAVQESHAADAQNVQRDLASSSEEDMRSAVAEGQRSVQSAMATVSRTSGLAQQSNAITKPSTSAATDAQPPPPQSGKPAQRLAPQSGQPQVGRDEEAAHGPPAGGLPTGLPDAAGTVSRQQGGSPASSVSLSDIASLLQGIPALQGALAPDTSSLSSSILSDIIAQARPGGNDLPVGRLEQLAAQLQQAIAETTTLTSDALSEAQVYEALRPAGAPFTLGGSADSLEGSSLLLGGAAGLSTDSSTLSFGSEGVRGGGLDGLSLSLDSSTTSSISELVGRPQLNIETSGSGLHNLLVSQMPSISEDPEDQSEAREEAWPSRPLSMPPQHSSPEGILPTRLQYPAQQERPQASSQPYHQPLDAWQEAPAKRPQPASQPQLPGPRQGAQAEMTQPSSQLSQAAAQVQQGAAERPQPAAQPAPSAADTPQHAAAPDKRADQQLIHPQAAGPSLPRDLPQTPAALQSLGRSFIGAGSWVSEVSTDLSLSALAAQMRAQTRFSGSSSSTSVPQRGHPSGGGQEEFSVSSLPEEALARAQQAALLMIGQLAGTQMTSSTTLSDLSELAAQGRTLAAQQHQLGAALGSASTPSDLSDLDRQGRAQHAQQAARPSGYPSDLSELARQGRALAAQRSAGSTAHAEPVGQAAELTGQQSEPGSVMGAESTISDLSELARQGQALAAQQRQAALVFTTTTTSAPSDVTTLAEQGRQVAAAQPSAAAAGAGAALDGSTSTVTGVSQLAAEGRQQAMGSSEKGSFLSASLPPMAENPQESVRWLHGTASVASSTAPSDLSALVQQGRQLKETLAAGAAQPEGVTRYTGSLLNATTQTQLQQYIAAQYGLPPASEVRAELTVASSTTPPASSVRPQADAAAAADRSAAQHMLPATAPSQGRQPGQLSSSAPQSSVQSASTSSHSSGSSHSQGGMQSQASAGREQSSSAYESAGSGHRTGYASAASGQHSGAVSSGASSGQGSHEVSSAASLSFAANLPAAQVPQRAQQAQHDAAREMVPRRSSSGFSSLVSDSSEASFEGLPTISESPMAYLSNPMFRPAALQQNLQSTAAPSLPTVYSSDWSDVSSSQGASPRGGRAATQPHQQQQAPPGSSAAGRAADIQAQQTPAWSAVSSSQAALAPPGPAVAASQDMSSSRGTPAAPSPAGAPRPEASQVEHVMLQQQDPSRQSVARASTWSELSSGLSAGQAAPASRWLQEETPPTPCSAMTSFLSGQATPQVLSSQEELPAGPSAAQAALEPAGFAFSVSAASVTTGGRDVGEGSEARLFLQSRHPRPAAALHGVAQSATSLTSEAPSQRPGNWSVTSIESGDAGLGWAGSEGLADVGSLSSLADALDLPSIAAASDASFSSSAPEDASQSAAPAPSSRAAAFQARSAARAAAVKERRRSRDAAASDTASAASQSPSARPSPPLSSQTTANVSGTRDSPPAPIGARADVAAGLQRQRLPSAAARRTSPTAAPANASQASPAGAAAAAAARGLSRPPSASPATAVPPGAARPSSARGRGRGKSGGSWK